MTSDIYVNQVSLADGTVLMDITDTTAQAGDVMSGQVFYAANGARTVGTQATKLDQVAVYPEYSPLSAYTIGVKVTHAGRIYKCRTAISTAEEWNAEHWTEITVGTDKADRQDTILDTTLSRGRRENSEAGVGSIAFGENVAASGNYSKATGSGTQATGFYSSAEGYNTTASGSCTHAEGNSTLASGANSHAEGGTTIASGNYSHAEGSGTTASNSNDHAEGSATTASGGNSHAEGSITSASGSNSHAEGSGTAASESCAHAEGSYTTAAGVNSHAEGGDTTASNTCAHAEGGNTTASNMCAHAEGGGTTASGSCAHAEGGTTIASGTSPIQKAAVRLHLATVRMQKAAVRLRQENMLMQKAVVREQQGDLAHAEGGYTTAEGVNSHAEGGGTTASGSCAHTEGGGTNASGVNSHAEGGGTTASGYGSHAEGSGTTASGEYAHAEGLYTSATGGSSHVSGMYNVPDSFANWNEWTANTAYAVGALVKRTQTTSGVTTVTAYQCKTANSDSTFKIAKWNNLGGRMNYAEIVGNGLNSNTKSNARALDWGGNEWLAGNLYVNSGNDSTGGNKVATEVFVTGKIGTANGIAELDANGKVPTAQLPSYVDDVLEYVDLAHFPETGETGKIYVALDTNRTYRWSGSSYVEISPSLALGETSSSAYRGDRGADAYAAAVTNVDATPTANSTHLVQSGGVVSAISTAVSGAVDLITARIVLQEENIPNTTQTVTFDNSGNVSQVVHNDGSNNTVRTDTFTYGTNTITEVRTATGYGSMTIVTNTATYTTTITYAAA